MDKTIKINLSGVLFQADEEAYRLLRDYLKAIDARFGSMKGGNETIEDIEARIAEILQSKRGLTGVILKEDVEEVISILGKPEDFDINDTREEAYVYSSPGRRTLYRNPDDTVIGGVCGGLGAYMNIQPVWVRLFFVVFALAYGIGFFVYLGLWIALPSANSDQRKRELYGDRFTDSFRRKSESAQAAGNNDLSGSKSDNSFGNALNQVFNAIGKFLFVVFRIFMIIFGVIFVISAFALLITAVLVFFFRSPGFMPGTFEGNFFYLPDVLDFIVNPGMTPWIIFLGFMVLVLPVLAFIYWGIKMIFWFRAKDGIISLVALVLWVISLTAFSIILANQGLGFSNMGRSTTEFSIDRAPDTLYVVTDRKIKDLTYDRAFDVPDDNYAIYMDSEKSELYIRGSLRLYTSEDNSCSVEVVKKTYGTGRPEASRKAESIPYNFRLVNDTLWLDEYFTLPKGDKWSGDNVTVRLSVPEETILWFDETSENMFDDNVTINGEHHSGVDPWELGNRYWRITEEDMERVYR